MSWIKMRTNLLSDPRVFAIAERTRKTVPAILGGLFSLWAIADGHTENGHLSHATFKALDRQIGIRGFCEALNHVGWIQELPDGLQIQHFDEHNGQSAKRRAAEAKRKHDERQAEDEAQSISTDSSGHPQAVRTASASCPQVVRTDADTKRTRCVPRKEKEREKEIPPSLRSGGSGCSASAIDPTASGELSAVVRTECGQQIADSDDSGLSNVRNDADITPPENAPENALSTREKRKKITPDKPHDVTTQVWEDWCNLRKNKKALVTATVIEAARRECAEANMTLDEFLREWCLRGSQGLKASWIDSAAKTSHGFASPYNQTDTVETLYDRAARERIEQICPSIAAKPPSKIKHMGMADEVDLPFV